MIHTEPTTVLMGVGAVLAVLICLPYLWIAIDFRDRDNGLAYIVLVMGVGIWNGFLAAQLLTEQPTVAGYFLSLGLVGALLAGLGWFLFASTASSTPDLPAPRLVYGALAAVVGVDISLFVTNPVHELFWTLPGATATPAFAAIVPATGYWLHTLLLVGLFVAGGWQFRAAWRAGRDARYTGTYTVVALLVAVAVLASSVLVQGGWTVAPFVAVGLAFTGWVQAQRGRVFEVLSSYRRRIGPTA